MSSVASLAAVTNNTRTSGTTVVNQDREEIWGIIWTTHTDTHNVKYMKIHEIYTRLTTRDKLDEHQND